jgi:cell division protein FtsW
MKIDFSKYDKQLIFIVVTLTICGLIMVLSSSYIMAGIRKQNSLLFFIKQSIWVGCGFAIMWVAASKVNYSFYRKYALHFYFLTICALILVLIFGPLWGGARRWFDLGWFAFQPSEFAKLALIIVMAKHIEKKKDFIVSGKGLMACTVFLVPIVVLIMGESDFGTNILIMFVWAAMLFCADIKFNKQMFFLVASVIAFAAIELIRKGYRWARMSVYFDGLVDIDSVLQSIDKTIYQLKFSFYAFGSGGIFGKGPGQSEMKLMYLPEAHTDFIYPIIGEEFGFVGAGIILALFVWLFFRGMKIARYAQDDFAKFCALGITLLIASQAIMNISVALGLVPTKGLVLPFISSGGTSLITNMAAAGILINLSQYSKRHQI